MTLPCPNPEVYRRKPGEVWYDCWICKNMFEHWWWRGDVHAEFVWGASEMKDHWPPFNYETIMNSREMMTWHLIHVHGIEDLDEIEKLLEHSEVRCVSTEEVVEHYKETVREGIADEAEE